MLFKEGFTKDEKTVIIDCLREIDIKSTFHVQKKGSWNNWTKIFNFIYNTDIKKKAGLI